MTIIALACALLSLAISVISIITRHSIWRLLLTVIKSACRCNSILCAFKTPTNKSNANITGDDTKITFAWQARHTKIEYRARLVRPESSDALDSRVLLTLHTSGKAKIDYGLQRITEFVYGTHRRELLLTEVVMGTSTTCDCSMNDDIEIIATGLWPTAPIIEDSNEENDQNRRNNYGQDSRY